MARIAGVSAREAGPLVQLAYFFTRRSIARLTGMFFDLGKCFLLPSAMQGIREIKKRFDANPKVDLLVVGHTDTSGQDAYNLTWKLAMVLDVSPHWLYDRMAKGTIQITREFATGLYLFPDTAETREQFQQFKMGHLQTLCFLAAGPNASPASPDSRAADVV